MIVRLTMTEWADEVYYVCTRSDTSRSWVGSIDLEPLKETLIDFDRYDAQALDDPIMEAQIAVDLAMHLLPLQLVDAVMEAREPKATVVVRPSPSVARVPFGLLEIEPGVRLMERAHTRTGYPIGLPHPVRQQASHPQGLLDVVDPHTSAASVLDSAGRRRWWELTRDLPGRCEPGGVVGRRDLHSQLTHHPPRAMLFYGHCVTDSAAPLAQSGLLLSDVVQDTTGLAKSRVLSARDLAVGTLVQPEPGLPDATPGKQIWPMPERVVIIGCSSAADSRSREPLGLAAVLHSNGAQWLVATLWDLPTDAVNGGDTSVLAAAAAAAAMAEDPEGALDAWLLLQLEQWRTHPATAASPRTWGALTTFTDVDYSYEDQAG